MVARVTKPNPDEDDHADELEMMPATMMSVEVLVEASMAADSEARPPPRAWRMQAMQSSMRTVTKYHAGRRMEQCGSV